MSRTIRRGNPTRNFHKYIGLGVLKCENMRYHFCCSIPGGWHHELTPEPMWRDRGYETYEDYAAYELQRYHMDYRPRDKCPGFMHREDTLKQKRQHKASLSKAMHSGDFDVVLEPYVNGAKRMWEWW